MLTQDICNALEYKIGAMFENFANPALKGFWCDGILLPTSENEYSKKYVNDNRKILLTTFIGKDGQEKYELTLFLGKKSLSKYARGLDILDCLPDPKKIEFLEIDVLKNKISIQLD